MSTTLTIRREYFDGEVPLVRDFSFLHVFDDTEEKAASVSHSCEYIFQ